MLQVEYRLKLGQDEFIIKAEVKDEKEFFETMSFYSNLPKAAPGGSTDLKLVFRTTKEGHKYYSLISDKEKMEYKLGQNLDKNGGGLFPKGWEKAYQGDADQQSQGQTQNAQAPLIGQQPVAQPQTQAAPAPQNFQPPVQMPTPQQFTAPAPIAAPTPAPAAAAPAAANPNVTAQANNVLSRFGIQK